MEQQKSGAEAPQCQQNEMNILFPYFLGAGNALPQRGHHLSSRPGGILTMRLSCLHLGHMTEIKYGQPVRW
jgi:hypothetical protein